MNAPTSDVTIKVNADTTDATRKIRELGREARRARSEIEGTTRWVRLTLEAIALVTLAGGLVWHDTFYVALACSELLLARR